jgi:hypothetical protein
MSGLKWLCEIISRARRKASGDILFAELCREEHDGHLAQMWVGVSPQRAAHLQAVPSWDAPIEEEERGPFGACQA